jgi:hypothetical protein
LLFINTGYIVRAFIMHHPSFIMHGL